MECLNADFDLARVLFISLPYHPPDIINNNNHQLTLRACHLTLVVEAPLYILVADCLVVIHHEWNTESVACA